MVRVLISEPIKVSGDRLVSNSQGARATDTLCTSVLTRSKRRLNSRDNMAATYRTKKALVTLRAQLGDALVDALQPYLDPLRNEPRFQARSSGN